MPSTTREAPLGVLAVGLVDQPHRREAPLAGEQLVRLLVLAGLAHQRRVQEAGLADRDRELVQVLERAGAHVASSPAPASRRRGDRAVRLGRGVGHRGRGAGPRRAPRAPCGPPPRAAARLLLRLLGACLRTSAGALKQTPRMHVSLDRIPERRGGPASDSRVRRRVVLRRGPRGRARSGPVVYPGSRPRPATRTCPRPARACAGSGA